MYFKLLVSAILLFSLNTFSQCAMCKAVVENGDRNYAEGLNNGIITLMIIPYLLVIVVGFVFWKYYKKNKNHVGKS